MITPNQIPERIKGVRQFQPSAIRNSILMAIIQLASFVGAFVLIGMSIYVYSSSSNLDPEHKNQIDFYIRKFKTFLHFRSEDSVDQAYFLLIIALLLLLIWKLTKMVRRRNAYILTINWAMDEKDE